MHSLTCLWSQPPSTLCAGLSQEKDIGDWASMDEYPRETQLVLACAAGPQGVGDADVLRRLASEGIDWDRLVSVCTTMKLLPLVHRNLEFTCSDLVPDTVASRMCALARCVAMRNDMLVAELSEIVALLCSHGVDALPFKGPTLAMLAYGSVALRQIRDLDVLVKRADAIKARDLLLCHGYHLLEDAPESDDSWVLANCHHFQLFSSRQGTRVEVHWRLAPWSFSFPLLCEELSTRTRAIEIAGTTLPCLTREDMLLIVSAHGVRHLWETGTGFGCFCDIAGLLSRSSAFDWGAAMSTARRVGVERIVLLSLLAVHDILSVPVPQCYLEYARNDYQIQRCAAQLLGMSPVSGRPAVHTIDNHELFMRMRERRIDRLTYAVHLVRSPRHRSDRWRTPLTAMLTVLYYGTWPLWRLARRLR